MEVSLTKSAALVSLRELILCCTTERCLEGLSLGICSESADFTETSSLLIETWSLSTLPSNTLNEGEKSEPAAVAILLIKSSLLYELHNKPNLTNQNSIKPQLSIIPKPNKYKIIRVLALRPHHLLASIITKRVTTFSTLIPFKDQTAQNYATFQTLATKSTKYNKTHPTRI